MNSAVPTESLRATPAARPPTFGAIAVWLLAVSITVFSSLLLKDSAVIEGAYLPRTNDSLYHARRILDAAGGEGFYQFDERLHAPDGSWVPWPWAYDFLMAKVAQAALWLDPSLEPLAVISHVPVAWILVNAALLMATCGAIGLPTESRLLVMLCFALSPLTQLLHAIAMLDHHYIEHTFVLATVWLGLRWFRAPDSARRSVALGIVLGLAPAFHSGLFILQLLPLVTLLALWVRKTTPPAAPMRAFCMALLVTTQLVLLPSEPYREGVFEFGLLSWFHFYVALATSLTVLFLAWKPFSRRTLAVLILSCGVMALPLAAQIVAGAGFLSGSFSILNQIVEVRSPLELVETLGVAETVSYYSWLVLLAPVLLLYFAYRALNERSPERLYYAVAATIGLALLLDQFRLHYFGFFALTTGGLLIIDGFRQRYGWHRGATFTATLAAIAIAYQPSLRERLFVVHAPGSDPEYANVFALYEELGRQCASDPGVVLASTDDGNPILFHTDCSVIANNFILRAEDAQHIDEVGRLMRLTPAEIRRQRPDVKYMLLRVRDFLDVSESSVKLAADSPIAMQLLRSVPPPPGFELLATVRWVMDEQGTTAIFARLYKIVPTDSEP